MTPNETANKILREIATIIDDNCIECTARDGKPCDICIIRALSILIGEGIS